MCQVYKYHVRSISSLLQLERSFQACIIFSLFEIHNIIVLTVITVSLHRYSGTNMTVRGERQRKTLITFKKLISISIHSTLSLSCTDTPW